MISEAAKKGFLNATADKNFTAQFSAYLTARLEEESNLALIAKEAAENEDIKATIKPRPVLIRVHLPTAHERWEVLSVGKDFAVVCDVKTKNVEALNLNQVVRWRDVSDEKQ